MVRTRNAQAVKQEITLADSFDVVSSMVQVGIAEICYARDILSEDSFQDVQIEGVTADSRVLNSGDGASAETKEINEWMTESVGDALKHRYITKLIFGLATDHDCREILEEYVFSFEYDTEGNISMGLGNAKGKQSFKRLAIDSAKRDVNKLLRSIVSITRTLDDLPAERFVFCKMEFAEDTPEEYQPPGFVDAGDRAVGFFAAKPFSMRLGDLTTLYHKCMLGVRSVLDSVDERAASEGPMGDNASAWEDTVASGAAASGGGSPVASEARHAGGLVRGHTKEDLAGLFSEPQEPENPPAPAAAAKADDVTARLEGLGFQEATTPRPSCAGGIHSVPGSVGTASVAVAAASRAAAAGDDEEMEQVEAEEEGEGAGRGKVWAGTQASDDVRRKRKASIVERPLHQKRTRRSSARLPAAAQGSAQPLQASVMTTAQQKTGVTFTRAGKKAKAMPTAPMAMRTRRAAGAREK